MGNAGYVFYPTPLTGAKSSPVTLTGSGLPPNTDLQLLFGSVQMGHCTTSPEGTVDLRFYVPLVSPGFYYISAKDPDGKVVATTSFTVVLNQPTASPTLPTLSASPKATPQQSPYLLPTANPTSYVNPQITWKPYPYSSATPKPVQSGISPLMIGIIAVAIVAVIIPVAFFIRRRGGPQPTYEERNETPTSPAPTYSPRTPATPTAVRYGQTPTYGYNPSRSTMASRSSTPSRYRQPSAVPTRVCPRCRQTVWAGSSICPHCKQRLR